MFFFILLKALLFSSEIFNYIPASQLKTFLRGVCWRGGWLRVPDRRCNLAGTVCTLEDPDHEFIDSWFSRLAKSSPCWPDPVASLSSATSATSSVGRHCTGPADPVLIFRGSWSTAAALAALLAHCTGTRVTDWRSCSVIYTVSQNKQDTWYSWISS